ncbi:ABC transporter permease [Candidatus Poriferisodalis sp.]|uniref:ABC transporter permease n=1 Tax=Candidatus Poriferisodalis sp. TaxID=3101277 RepID=UPI003B0165F2
MAAAAGGADERLAYRGPIQQLLTRPEIGALLGLVGVWLLFWLTSEAFGTAGGTANFLDVAALLGIMAVPVALLMIGGEFDLSAGAMTGATAIFVILMSREVGELGGAGFSLHLAVPLSLAFALAIGWFNGTLVERTSLPSFIVTLGTFFILIGAKLGFGKLFTNKVIVEGLDDAAGYAFWDDIFGAEWIRNQHIWDGRDWAWAGLLVFAGVASFLGLLEMTYARRADVSGWAALGGLAGAVVAPLFGFFMLLSTDGVEANLVWGALVALGTLAGVAIWCAARYEPVQRRTRSSDSRTNRAIGLGVAAVVAAIVAARALDATNADQLGFLGGGLGRAVFALGIAATGVLAALAATGHVRTSAPVIGVAVALVPTVSFMMTVQAARVVLFGGLAVAGVVTLMLTGARNDQSLWLPMGTAVIVAVAAFVVRAESASRKLRVELFSLLLLIALALAAAAVAKALAQRRSSAVPAPVMGPWARAAAIAGAANAVSFATIELVDGDGLLYALSTGAAKGGVVALGIYALATFWRLLFADGAGIGRSLVTVGLAAAGLALAVKLMFITTVEEQATQAVTRFRVSVLFYLLFAAVGAWVLARTRFGSWTFAVGGNKDAARSVGVPAARTKTTLFMLVSVCAWVAGMLIAFRLNSVQANVGDGNEFRYIIVAVVGGNLLTGGYGSAIGAAIGALIWGMISQGIGFARWNTDWRFLVLGGLLVVAVIVNNYVRQRAERSQSARGDPGDDEPPGGDHPARAPSPERSGDRVERAGRSDEAAAQGAER